MNQLVEARGGVVGVCVWLHVVVHAVVRGCMWLFMWLYNVWLHTWLHTWLVWGGRVGGAYLVANTELHGGPKKRKGDVRPRRRPTTRPSLVVPKLVGRQNANSQFPTHTIILSIVCLVGCNLRLDELGRHSTRTKHRTSESVENVSVCCCWRGENSGGEVARDGKQADQL